MALPAGNQVVDRSALGVTSSTPLSARRQVDHIVDSATGETLVEGVRRGNNDVNGTVCRYM